MTGRGATLVGAAIEIADIVLARPLDGVAAFNLESPASGSAHESFWLPVVGWALPAAEGPVRLAVTQDEVGVSQFAANGVRPDVETAFPRAPHARACGFSVALSVVRLPQRFRLVLRNTSNGQSSPLAEIAGERRAFPAVGEVSPAPLAVTTLGRTGSTLAVTLLGNHPEITAWRPHDQDSRPFAYHLETASALSEPSSFRGLVNSDVTDSEWWLGRRHAPVDGMRRIDPVLRDWLGTERVESLLSWAIEASCAFAERAALAQGKDAPRYAVEKCWPNHIPRLMAELCPEAREIVLVRDFRDVLASILAFNAKRGYPAFGREAVDSDEEFVMRLARDVRRLVASWRERKREAFSLRYEDLVAEPASALRQVFLYLGVDASEAQVQEVLARSEPTLGALRAAHQTSATPEASVGRWRRDLPPRLQEIASDALADFLSEFDYS